MKQANILKTAKDLYVKEVFYVTNTEVSQNKGQRFGRVAFSGSVYTSSTSDYLIGVTQLGGDLVAGPTIGLPRPSLVGSGKTFIVKDEAGGAATTTITIRSAGEETIDGASTATITSNFGSKDFYTNGSVWFTK